MPELPEVETVKKSLQELVLNKVIKEVVVNYDRIIQTDLGKFKNNLVNQKINEDGSCNMELSTEIKRDLQKYYNISEDKLIVAHAGFIPPKQNNDDKPLYNDAVYGIKKTKTINDAIVLRSLESYLFSK